ncbi:hypothetical protein JHK87_027483 [Glycine soja]|nr:hypothetical protein JHK87_027483 [Glycine soja]
MEDSRQWATTTERERIVCNLRKLNRWIKCVAEICSLKLTAFLKPELLLIVS